MSEPIPEPRNFARHRRKAQRRSDKASESGGSNVSAFSDSAALALARLPGHEGQALVPYSGPQAQASLFLPAQGLSTAAGAVGGISADNVQVINNFYSDFHAYRARGHDEGEAAQVAGDLATMAQSRGLGGAGGAGAPPKLPPAGSTTSGDGPAERGGSLHGELLRGFFSSSSFKFYVLVGIILYLAVTSIQHYVTSTVGGAVSSVTGVIGTAAGLVSTLWPWNWIGNAAKKAPLSAATTTATMTFGPIPVKSLITNTAGLSGGIRMMSSEAQAGNHMFTSLLQERGFTIDTTMTGAPDGGTTSPAAAATAGQQSGTLEDNALSLCHQNEAYVIMVTTMLTRERGAIARLRGLLEPPNGYGGGGSGSSLPPSRPAWCGRLNLVAGYLGLRHQCPIFLMDIIQETMALYESAQADRDALEKTLFSLLDNAHGMQHKACNRVPNKALWEAEDRRRKGSPGTDKASLAQLEEAVASLRQYAAAGTIVCNQIGAVIKTLREAQQRLDEDRMTINKIRQGELLPGLKTVGAMRPGDSQEEEIKRLVNALQVLDRLGRNLLTNSGLG